MITGILLASGFSRRFGSNKLLHMVGGLPLFVHVLTAMQQSQLDQILVVTCYSAIETYCNEHALPVISNSTPQQGQSASVVLGTKAAPPDSHLMFFPADQPYLDPTTINQLIDLSLVHPSKIIVPTVEGKFKSSVIFPPAMRGDLLDLAGDSGGKQIFAKYPALLHLVPMQDSRPFDDIDTTSDLQT